MSVCKRCHGIGRVWSEAQILEGAVSPWDERQCPECLGTGHRISEKRRLRLLARQRKPFTYRGAGGSPPAPF